MSADDVAVGGAGAEVVSSSGSSVCGDVVVRLLRRSAPRVGDRSGAQISNAMGTATMARMTTPIATTFALERLDSCGSSGSSFLGEVDHAGGSSGGAVGYLLSGE